MERLHTEWEVAALPPRHHGWIQFKKYVPYLKEYTISTSTTTSVNKRERATFAIFGLKASESFFSD